MQLSTTMACYAVEQSVAQHSTAAARHTSAPHYTNLCSLRAIGSTSGAVAMPATPLPRGRTQKKLKAKHTLKRFREMYPETTTLTFIVQQQVHNTRPCSTTIQFKCFTTLGMSDEAPYSGKHQ